MLVQITEFERKKGVENDPMTFGLRTGTMTFC